MKRYIFIVAILFSINIAAQNSKIDSLAKEIHFKIKDTILKKGSLKIIKEIAVLLKENKYSYRLESHTDSRGRHQDNDILTQKRANFVKRILTNLGISEIRLNAMGFGEIYPLNSCIRVSSDSETGRIEFRRINKKTIVIARNEAIFF